MYACNYPHPQPPCPQELRVASPSSLQRLNLYTVVSHLLEEEENLPILQKRAKTQGFEFGIS